MTFTTKRAEIAAALSKVPDVHATEHRPPVFAEGSAWPMLGPWKRSKGDAFDVQWRIRVVLPQDEEAASTWLDAHWDALFYALAPVGFVTTVTPVMLPAGGGDLYALEIVMNAEE